MRRYTGRYFFLTHDDGVDGEESGEERREERGEEAEEERRPQPTPQQHQLLTLHDDDDGTATKRCLLLNDYLQTCFFPSPGLLVQSSLLSFLVRPANQPLRASLQLEVTATPEEATWQCVAARKRDESAQRAHRVHGSSSISSRTSTVVAQLLAARTRDSKTFDQSKI